MTEAEFYAYQEKAFDAFCMKVIHNAAVSIHRKLSTQSAHEVPFNEMADNALSEFWAEDCYPVNGAVFYASGEAIAVYDPALSLALQYITPQLREIVLLSYFLDHSESQIGKMLHLSKSTVNARKAAALRHLREMIEATEDG